MTTPRPNARTAANRREAEARLASAIERFAPASERIVATARKVLRKRLPSAFELVYEYRDWFVISFSPNEHGHEGVVALRANAEGVRLCLNRGKSIPDPEKLLRGSGSQVRWVRLEDPSSIERPAIARLIDEAIERNPVPFATRGRGPIVIRSAAK